MLFIEFDHISRGLDSQPIETSTVRVTKLSDNSDAVLYIDEAGNTAYAGQIVTDESGRAKGEAGEVLYIETADYLVTTEYEGEVVNEEVAYIRAQQILDAEADIDSIQAKIGDVNVPDLSDRVDTVESILSADDESLDTAQERLDKIKELAAELDDLESSIKPIVQESILFDAIRYRSDISNTRINNATTLAVSKLVTDLAANTSEYIWIEDGAIMMKYRAPAFVTVKFSSRFIQANTDFYRFKIKRIEDDSTIASVITGMNSRDDDEKILTEHLEFDAIDKDDSIFSKGFYIELSNRSGAALTLSNYAEIVVKSEYRHPVYA